MKKKIIYVDMDNVLVNFQSGVDSINPSLLKMYAGSFDEIPDIFRYMLPNEGAIEGFNKLFDSGKFDVYILSTAPWENPTAWVDKLLWVKKYLPKAYKRLILSHNKQLNNGDYLIDDRTANGAGEFDGELIQFGSKQFPDWGSVLNYLL